MVGIVTNKITCAYGVLMDIRGMYLQLVLGGSGNIWCYHASSVGFAGFLASSYFAGLEYCLLMY